MHFIEWIIWSAGTAQAFVDPTCKDCVNGEIARELPIIRPRGFDPNLLMVCDDLLSPDDLYASQQSIMVRIEDALRRNRCNPRHFQVHERPIRVENLHGSLNRMPLAHLRRHPILGAFVETIMIKSEQLIAGAEDCHVDWRILQKVNRMFSKMLMNRLACSQIEQDYLRDRLGWRRKYGTRPHWRHPAMPHLGRHPLHPGRSWPWDPSHRFHPNDPRHPMNRGGRSWPWNPRNGGRSWPRNPQNGGRSWPWNPRNGGRSWPWNPRNGGRSWPWNPQNGGRSWPWNPRNGGRSWPWNPDGRRPWHPAQVVSHTIIPVVPWHPHHPCYWRRLHQPWMGVTRNAQGQPIPTRWNAALPPGAQVWPHVPVGSQAWPRPPAAGGAWPWIPSPRVGITHRFGRPTLCRRCRGQRNTPPRGGVPTPPPAAVTSPSPPPALPPRAGQSWPYTPTPPRASITPPSISAGRSWPHTPRRWDPVRGRFCRHCRRSLNRPTPPMAPSIPPPPSPPPARPSGQSWPWQPPTPPTKGHSWPWKPPTPMLTPKQQIRWSPRKGLCRSRRCRKCRRRMMPPAMAPRASPPSAAAPPTPRPNPPSTPTPQPSPQPAVPLTAGRSWPYTPPAPSPPLEAGTPSPAIPNHHPRIIREAIANGPGNCVDDA